MNRHIDTVQPQGLGGQALPRGSLVEYEDRNGVLRYGTLAKKVGTIGYSVVDDDGIRPLVEAGKVRRCNSQRFA